MEEKIFELLTILHNDIKDLKEGQKVIDNRLIKIETTIENEINPNIKASLEGYQMVYEKQKEQEQLLVSIDNKLEKQEVEITVIKGGKVKKIK